MVVSNHNSWRLALAVGIVLSVGQNGLGPTSHSLVAFACVDVNRASFQELATVRGVSRQIAAMIVEGRLELTRDKSPGEGAAGNRQQGERKPDVGLLLEVAQLVQGGAENPCLGGWCARQRGYLGRASFERRIKAMPEAAVWWDRLSKLLDAHILCEPRLTHCLPLDSGHGGACKEFIAAKPTVPGGGLDAATITSTLLEEANLSLAMPATVMRVGGSKAFGNATPNRKQIRTIAYAESCSDVFSRMEMGLGEWLGWTIAWARGRDWLCMCTDKPCEDFGEKGLTTHLHVFGAEDLKMLQKMPESDDGSYSKMQDRFQWLDYDKQEMRNWEFQHDPHMQRLQLDGHVVANHGTRTLWYSVAYKNSTESVGSSPEQQQ